MQGLQAAPGFAWLLIVQLVLGGLAIFYMDELTTKWGFGSGVSLFIGAGVSWRIMTGAFQFIDQQGRNCLLDFKTIPCAGKVFVVIQSVINRFPLELFSAGAAIISTIIIFLIVVWAQSLKVEIPLSFGRLRGYGVKSISFLFLCFSYSCYSNCFALIANIQLFGGIVENLCCTLFFGRCLCRKSTFCFLLYFLGKFNGGQAISGLAFWLGNTNLLELTIRGGFSPKFLIQGLTHILFFMFFSTLFAVFWVKTARHGCNKSVP